MHLYSLHFFMYNKKSCGSVSPCPPFPPLPKPNPHLLYVFQECCLCNLRGGALKTTTDNRLVTHACRKIVPVAELIHLATVLAKLILILQEWN